MGEGVGVALGVVASTKAPADGTAVGSGSSERPQASPVAVIETRAATTNSFSVIGMVSGLLWVGAVSRVAAHQAPELAVRADHWSAADIADYGFAALHRMSHLGVPRRSYRLDYPENK